jgi:hypothetical protein
MVVDVVISGPSGISVLTKSFCSNFSFPRGDDQFNPIDQWSLSVQGPASVTSSNQFA